MRARSAPTAFLSTCVTMLLHLVHLISLDRTMPHGESTGMSVLSHVATGS